LVQLGGLAFQPVRDGKKNAILLVATLGGHAGQPPINARLLSQFGPSGHRSSIKIVSLNRHMRARYLTATQVG
jgi:hypothetical protein